MLVLELEWGEFTDQMSSTVTDVKALLWGEIDSSEDKSMLEVLNMQWNEADSYFAEFVEDNYQRWIQEPSTPRPTIMAFATDEI